MLVVEPLSEICGEILSSRPGHQLARTGASSDSRGGIMFAVPRN